jgi:hypothetical protein
MQNFRGENIVLETLDVVFVKLQGLKHKIKVRGFSVKV